VRTDPTPQRRDDAALTLAGIGKSYGGDAPVLDGVDLTVRQGEFLTVLGPSGSGKTTLLMIIAGFVRPDRGSLRTPAGEITELPPHRRGLGVVFQNYALFPTMNVRQNVEYPLAVRKVPRDERAAAVERALALVHLSGFERRRTSELSGGQQQRVALARALVYRPSVILLDEPLGALDRSLREQMQLELRALNRELGTTFVLVTHDQDEAMTMSDRVLVMQGGRIEQLGAPDALYERPASRFVAEFLGRANLLTGVITDDGSLRLADGTVLPLPPRAEAVRGSQRTLMIRPERIRIAEPADGWSIPGTVVRQVYVGDEWRLTLHAAGREVDIRATRRHPDGSELRLAWPPEDSYLIPAPNASEGEPNA